MSFPWSVNKFFSTWINASNTITGTYGNVSLRVDGKTQLANATTTALGVNKDSGATYALDVNGNSYSTNYFMDSAQSITENGQLIPKIYADENLVTTIGKSKLMQSTIITATANGQYYWNFGDPQLMVFLTNAGPININLPNVTSASNIGATFTIKKNNQQINAIASAGFTLLNESNQVLSTAIIGFSTVQVVSFTAISTTGSQWCVSYSQGPNFQVVATLQNGQTFVSGAKTFNTNTTFGATYSMTINAQATFNTVLPTTTITLFPNSNQFITKGYADSTYASGAGFMDLTTNQTAGGIKTFSSPPVMSGASITAGTIPTNAFAGGFVDLTTNQSVGGIKTFTSPPVMSGASITAGTIPTNAFAGGFVDLTTNQSVGGIKTFTSNVVINSGFLLPYHPAGTSSLRIGNNSMTGAVGATSLNLAYGNNSLNTLTSGNYVIGIGHNQTCASNQNNTTLIGTNSVATTEKNNTVYFGGNDGAGNYQDIVIAKKNRLYSTQTAVSGTSILLEFETPENVVIDNVNIININLPAILATYNIGTKYSITRSNIGTSGITIDAGIGYNIQSKSGLNQNIYWSENSTTIILVCVSTTKWNVVFDDFVSKILTTESASNASMYVSFFPENINGGYQNPITSSSLTYNPSNGLLSAITIQASTALKQTGLNGFGGFYPNLAGTMTLAFGDPEIVVFENTPAVTAVQLPSVGSENIGAKFTFIQRDINRNYNLLTTSPDLIYDFKRQYSTSTFACNGIGSITIAAVITGGGTNAWAVVNRSDEIASAAVSVIAANFSLATAANLPIRDSYSVANGATAITITLPQITLNNLGMVIVFRRVATATATVSFIGNGTQFVYDGALTGGAGAQGIMISTTYTVRFTALVVSGTTYAWFRT